MDAETKKLWVEALRSGKYKQGRYYLQSIRDNESLFCVNGVLCDIVDPEGWELPCDHYKNKVVEHGNDICIVPREIAAKAHIDYTTLQAISIMNDQGTTFPHIADYIEANL
jgi:hypothetical protein